MEMLGKIPIFPANLPDYCFRMPKTLLDRAVKELSPILQQRIKLIPDFVETQEDSVCGPKEKELKDLTTESNVTFEYVYASMYVHVLRS